MSPLIKNPSFGDTSCFCLFYFIFAYYRLLQSCLQNLLSPILSFSFKSTLVKVTSEFQMFNLVVNFQFLFYLICFQPLSEQIISFSLKKFFIWITECFSFLLLFYLQFFCIQCVTFVSGFIQISSFLFKYLFIYLAMQHVGSQFLAQGWNLCRVLNWISREVPSLCICKIHPFHGCIAVHAFLWLNMVYEYGMWLTCSPL